MYLLWLLLAGTMENQLAGLTEYTRLYLHVCSELK